MCLWLKSPRAFLRDASPTRNAIRTTKISLRRCKLPHARSASSDLVMGLQVMNVLVRIIWSRILFPMLQRVCPLTMLSGTQWERMVSQWRNCGRQACGTSQKPSSAAVDKRLNFTHSCIHGGGQECWSALLDIEPGILFGVLFQNLALCTKIKCLDE